MHIGYLALYGGPDQVMGVTSGLAGLLGLLLIFWNKLVGTFFRILGKFGGNKPAVDETRNDASDQTS